MNRIALTIDIEDWYHTPLITGSTFSRYKSVEEFFDKWDKRFDYLSQPTKKVLDILDEYNIKATFFIVADIAYNYPGLIEKIANNGHEIACHGLHHEMIVDEKGKPRLSLTDFKNNMNTAKKKLESISRKVVVGYRAPSAYISGWMLDTLEKIGFKYDSSVCINSIYSKMEKKTKNVTTIPYFPIKGSLEKGNEKRDILEIPWPYWNFLGFKFPTAGGPFLRYFGAQYIIGGLNQSLKRGHTVFYFHPLDISKEKFPIQFSKKRPFYWYGVGEKTERNVIKILKKYRNKFTTIKNLLEIDYN